MFLNEQQTAIIRAAAADIQPDLRSLFLNSVQDDLFSLGRTVRDDDVERAISGVTWAINVGMRDDDD